MNHMQELLGYTEADIVSETKVCAKCSETKHISEFGTRAFNQDGSGQTHNFCKSCGRIQASALNKMKKEIPLPDKDYKCPGCKMTEQEIKDKWKSFQNKNITVWRLDHDHNQLIPREYLCDYCNNTVGRCESPTTLRALADYLEKYGIND